MKPIQYGPFKIIRKISDNAFQFELSAYMEIYSVVNISNLKPFEPSILDDELEEILPSVDDLFIDRKMMLAEDIILEKKYH